MKLHVAKNEAGDQQHLTMMERLSEIFYKSNLNWMQFSNDATTLHKYILLMTTVVIFNK